MTSVLKHGVHHEELTIMVLVMVLIMVLVMVLVLVLVMTKLTTILLKGTQVEFKDPNECDTFLKSS